jgi:hypothetical protein
MIAERIGLFFHHTAYLCTHTEAYIYKTTTRSVCLSVCLSFSLSLSFYLPACLPVCLCFELVTFEPGMQPFLYQQSSTNICSHIWSTFYIPAANTTVMTIRLCSVILEPLNPWTWRKTLTEWHSTTAWKTSVLHMNLLLCFMCVGSNKHKYSHEKFLGKQCLVTHLYGLYMYEDDPDQRKFVSRIIWVMGTVTWLYYPHT